jgi:cysteinyl-tRNA synthetase
VALSLYNTATRRKEAFRPLDPAKVRLYVCGPTVYDLPHIGNARPLVVFDLLFRMLRLNYGESHVVYVRNITDIDDKIIAAAKERNEPIEALTRRMTEAFHADAKALGCLAPTFEPRASEYIPAMIAMIETLLAKGHAYAADGHVLFHVPSMADYGKLSGRNRDELIAGARVEVAPYKRDPADFVLWKPSAAEVPGWSSPWGRGRPGWHIECSSMSNTLLGKTFDIHGGGRDLVFPHHENEVAQSVAANGAPFARCWVHNGFVTVGGEKMAKSVGNVIGVHELLARYSGEAIRLAIMKTHYRQPLDWTDDMLAEARSRLDYLYRSLIAAPGRAKEGRAVDPPAAVREALEDDLNTPEALAALYRVRDPDLLRVGASLLGLLQADPEEWFKWQPEGVAADQALIEDLIAKRARARLDRDFAAADRIRKELEEQYHIVLEDGPTATEWRRK